MKDKSIYAGTPTAQHALVLMTGTGWGTEIIYYKSLWPADSMIHDSVEAPC